VSYRGRAHTATSVFCMRSAWLIRTDCSTAPQAATLHVLVPCAADPSTVPHPAHSMQNLHQQKYGTQAQSGGESKRIWYTLCLAFVRTSRSRTHEGAHLTNGAMRLSA
jgi:hypothetical protein